MTVALYHLALPHLQLHYISILHALATAFWIVHIQGEMAKLYKVVDPDGPQTSGHCVTTN